jgi:hypothetical protein
MVHVNVVPPPLQYVGINELITANENLILYPNPSTGAFIISFPLEGQCSLNIFNITGEQVFEKEFDGKEQKIQIQAEELPSGIYFLQLHSKKGTYTKKLAIEK